MSKNLIKNENNIIFYEDENGKMHKELKNKVRVRVEVENWYIHNKHSTIKSAYYVVVSYT